MFVCEVFLKLFRKDIRIEEGERVHDKIYESRIQNGTDLFDKILRPMVAHFMQKYLYI